MDRKYDTNIKTVSEDVAMELGITKAEAKRVTRAVLDCLFKAMVNSDTVCLQGYFTSEICMTKGREYNMFGEKKVVGESKRTIKIKPGKKMLEAVRGN